jgi:UDP-GlcNAc:undecaprenyl-phosphate/decaprenyl-phosphate GlcNAc-1-phosphate transferase
MMMFIPSGTPTTIIGSFPLVVGAAVILGGVGLADDFRSLPRSLRLAAQIAAAVAAYAAGFGVSSTPWEALDLVLSIIWIVGITNAFNLLDNMDGLTSGLAGIAGLSFAVMGVVGSMPLVTVAAASLAGASFGFFAHNRHPAKIFMGDAGSNFIGFMLALIGARLRFDNLVEVTFLVPVIVLGLPILDTTLVVVSRKLHGRPMFLGGRDHISHRLVHLGLSVPIAVGLLFWTGLCLGWLGLVVSRADVLVGWMLLSFVLAMGLFFGILLLRVPVYEEEFEDVSDLQEVEEREGDEFTAAVDNSADELPSHRRAPGWPMPDR